MTEINVSRNVYNAVTSASQDKQISAQEMQRIVQEINADHQISDDEQRLLESLRTGSSFTLKSGSAQTPIEPAQMSFPSATPTSSHTGHQIGSTSDRQAIKLGPLQQSFVSEHDAQKFARAQWGVTDVPDLVILQGPDGKYNVHTLEIPDMIRNDGRDLGSYSDIRSSSFNNLPAGTRLMGVYSDDNAFRAYGREAAPTRQYAPIQNPQPGDTVASLRIKATQVADRLRDMNATLGPQKDHRGIFSAMYSVITDRAIAEMDRFTAAGDPVAAEFEGRLLVNFANKYFEAYDNYTNGNMNAVPEVWRSAFDSGRNAEAVGYDKASITEVTGLSMVAHIIHDLPLTLQEIGYIPGGRAEEVYDHFNVALMEEKNNIMSAIEKDYGRTDMHLLERAFTVGMAGAGAAGGGLFGGSAGTLGGRIVGSHGASALQQGMFTLMRNDAKSSAVQGLTQPQIERRAIQVSDLIRNLTPGGN